MDGPLVPVVFGFFVGLASTVAGVGGGAFIVPFLLLYANFDNKIAVGTSLIIIFITRILVSVVNYHERYINYRCSLVVVASSVPGIVLGYQLNRMMPASVFSLLLALLLLIISWTMMRGKDNGVQNENSSSNALMAIIGFVAGMISSAFGVGSGFICVPAFFSLLHMDLKKSVATSNFTLLFFTLFGSVFYVIESHYDAGYLLLLGIPTTIGSFLAAVSLKDTRDKIIRLAFSILLAFTSLNIIYREATRYLR